MYVQTEQASIAWSSLIHGTRQYVELWSSGRYNQQPLSCHTGQAPLHYTTAGTNMYVRRMHAPSSELCPSLHSCVQKHSCPVPQSNFTTLPSSKQASKQASVSHRHTLIHPCRGETHDDDTTTTTILYNLLRTNYIKLLYLHRDIGKQADGSSTRYCCCCHYSKPRDLPLHTNKRCMNIDMLTTNYRLLLTALMSEPQQ